MSAAQQRVGRRKGARADQGACAQAGRGATVREDLVQRLYLAHAGEGRLQGVHDLRLAVAHVGARRRAVRELRAAGWSGIAGHKMGASSAGICGSAGTPGAHRRVGHLQGGARFQRSGLRQGKAIRPADLE